LKLGIPLRFRFNLRDPALRETARIALPATIFIIMNLLVVAFMNSFSLAAADNGPSTLSFAWLWYQLPYGVIGVALSTTLFTEMSAASAAEDWPTFRTNVHRGLRTTIFMITPLAAMLFALANQLAGLYFAGEFNFQDVTDVAQVLSVWCVTLPFYAGYMYLYRAFSSLRDLKLFIAIDAVGRVFQALLYAFFTTGFGFWEGIGLIGIPLTDVIIYCLLFFVMSRVLQHKIGSFGLEGILGDGARILVAAVLAAALPAIVAHSGFNGSIPVSLLTIVICGLIGLGLYYLLCKLLKIPEISVVSDLLVRVGRRLRKSAKKGG
jgi:putative peptidoglycan lipid II flippase